MDRDRWREMEIDPEFAKAQEEVIAAYRKLGLALECTCTPYYLYETATVITSHGPSHRPSFTQTP